MNWGTRQPRILLLACALAGLAYASAAPAPEHILLALFAGAVGVVLTGPLVGLRLPRWATGLAAVAVLLRTGELALRDGLDIHDFAEFVAWMMAVKVFDRRSAGDEAQLLSLSVFLCVASMLVSNALAVAILSFLYLPCVAYAAMQVQLLTSLERAQRLASKGADAAEPPKVTAAAGAGAVRALGRTLALGLVAGFLIAAVVFVVLPRGAGLRQLGAWGNPGVGRVVGFADRVRIGMGGVISLSDTPVLHLRTSDSSGNLIGGLGAARYLRGAVLDTYDSGTWTASREPSLVGERSEHEAFTTEALGGSGSSASLHQHITLLNTPREYSYVFTVWRPVEVTFVDATLVAVDRREGTVMVAGRGGKLRYIVRSSEHERETPRGSTREPTSWDSSEVARVAAGILRDANLEPDPRARSIADDSLALNAFRRYFWSRYTYSLDAPPPPHDVDPIDWFLTEGSSGHCEYYASGLAALCRSVGIPARVVTGYLAAEFNTATGHYVVRERNAHAWVEAQVEPGVWKTYDATPPSDLVAQHGPEPGLLARAGRALDAINYAWINSVVSFDSDTRSTLLDWSEPVSGAVSARVDRLVRTARLAPPKALVRAAVRVTAAVVGGFVAAILVIALLRRLRTHLASLPRALPRKIDDREARERVRATPVLQEMLTMLRRAGIHKPAWQPAGAWADSLASRSDSLAATTRALADLYYVMRFGGRELTPSERAEARRLLDELAELLHASRGSV